MHAREKRPTVLAAVLQWCRNRGAATAVRYSPNQDAGGGVMRPAMDVFEAAAPPRYHFYASLLFACMDRFHVDRGELASEEPLRFRELQGLCTLCRAKETCSRDLQFAFDAAQRDRWSAYCPNAATLSMISVVQSCRRAAEGFTVQ